MPLANNCLHLTRVSSLVPLVFVKGYARRWYRSFLKFLLLVSRKNVRKIKIMKIFREFEIFPLQIQFLKKILCHFAKHCTQKKKRKRNKINNESLPTEMFFFRILKCFFFLLRAFNKISIIFFSLFWYQFCWKFSN